MPAPTRPVDVRCPACNAEPGVGCRTKGNRPTEPHGPRADLFKQTAAEIRKLNTWNNSCELKGRST
jgi:hypothetical protein